MDNAAKGANEENQKEGKKKDRARWELKAVKKYIY